MDLEISLFDQDYPLLLAWPLLDAASDKDSALVAIFEVAFVAAPIAPHEFVPGTNIDDSTRQISLSQGDFNAQTDNFGSSKKINQN
jgi:hypothetical protein